MPLQVTTSLFFYAIVCVPGVVIYFISMCKGWVPKWRKNLMITSWVQIAGFTLVSISLGYFAFWYEPLVVIYMAVIVINLGLNICGAVICTIFWCKKQPWDDGDITHYHRDQEEEEVVGLVSSAPYI